MKNTLNKLEKAGELKNLIITTKNGIDEISKLLEKGNNDERNYTDNASYSLSISEHEDGSGLKLKLNRYMGNKSLLETIKSKLEEQLTYFLEEAKNL